MCTRLTWKTSLFCRLSGKGNSIFRSSLPGRRSAGSNVSARLVAMITLTFTVWSNPSIYGQKFIKLKHRRSKQDWETQVWEHNVKSFFLLLLLVTYTCTRSWNNDLNLHPIIIIIIILKLLFDNEEPSRCGPETFGFTVSPSSLPSC